MGPIELVEVGARNGVLLVRGQAVELERIRDAIRLTEEFVVGTNDVLDKRAKRVHGPLLADPVDYDDCLAIL
jgi:hypothetical protein